MEVIRLDKKQKISKKLKSKAKVAGVKSTFKLNNNILMTSFGKGNDAILEKSIVNDKVTDLNEKKVFDVKVEDDILQIESKIISGSQISKASLEGKDGIGAKDELEKRYFGKAFQNENMRIQIIYNILDIDKILAVYANNILFALNNLRRKPLEEEELDYIGMIYTGADYKQINNPNPSNIKYYQKNKIAGEGLKKYCDEIEEYAVYFGDTLCKIEERTTTTPKGKVVTEKVAFLKKPEEIYNLMRVISIIRQSTFHGETFSSRGKMLYNLEIQNAEIQSTINKYYATEIEKINIDFVQNNTRNMRILFNIYEAEAESEQEVLTQQFFDFVIMKDNLNLGFSLRTLREIMMEYNDAVVLKDKEYDSVRRKMYMMLDFILYKHCIEKNLTDGIVEKLRKSQNENEKQSIYTESAQQIWKEVRDTVIVKMLPYMNGDYISSIDESAELIKNKWLDGRRLKTNANLFAAAIYIMTLFLDGKEINELVSQLINKFENISSLIQTLESVGEKCTFLDNYKLLCDSKNIAKELRIIKSIARMKKTLPVVNTGIYRDAVSFLGLPGEDVHKYVNEKLAGKDKGLINFITNNLIKSSRFQYISRYCNPSKARKIAENCKLVNFVLKRIPESQINRYYESVHGPEQFTQPDERIDYLADIITGMSFKNMDSTTLKSAKDNIETERKKAVLTVIYIAVKNLVNINARYVMAISAFERDASLFDEKVYFSRKTREEMKRKGEYKEPNYLALADMYMERLKSEIVGLQKQKQALSPEERNRMTRVNKKITKRQHVIDCIVENKLEFDAKVYKAYRDIVVHLNAVSNANLYIQDIDEITSYYDVYQYVIQRCIIERLKPEQRNSYINAFADCLAEYKAYNKNFVKVLNLPFAYNQPRYKNLTIKDLFNDKDDKQNKN